MNPAWLKLFQCAWFIGFLGGGLVYYLICLAFPPPGRPFVRESFGNETGEMTDGIKSADSGFVTPVQDVEKNSFATETNKV